MALVVGFFCPGRLENPLTLIGVATKIRPFNFGGISLLDASKWVLIVRR